MIRGNVALIAPCGAYNVDKFEAGCAIIRARTDLTLTLLPGGLEPHRYLAANDRVRLAHLNQALTDPRFDAVWIIRGGYGLTRIVDGVDWDNVRNIPVLGFSDVTALHAAMLANGKGIPIHAPMPHSLPATDKASVHNLFEYINNGRLPSLTGDTWIEGQVTAPMVGGNLALLGALCGSPWQVDAAGKILFIEDIGEPVYRLDRLIQQLKTAGSLDGIQGVACGEFTSCRSPQGVSWGMKEIVIEHFESMNIPVIGNLPVGHGSENKLFVQGKEVSFQDGTIVPTPSDRALV